jgi:hypothetical protein
VRRADEVTWLTRVGLRWCPYLAWKALDGLEVDVTCSSTDI